MAWGVLGKSALIRILSSLACARRDGNQLRRVDQVADRNVNTIRGVFELGKVVMEWATEDKPEECCVNNVGMQGERHITCVDVEILGTSKATKRASTRRVRFMLIRATDFLCEGL